LVSDGWGGRNDGEGMAAPWMDATIWRSCNSHLAFSTSDHCSIGWSARGALGDGGVAGRVSLRHCPGHASDSLAHSEGGGYEKPRLSEPFRRCAAWRYVSTFVLLLSSGRSVDRRGSDFRHLSICGSREPAPQWWASLDRMVRFIPQWPRTARPRLKPRATRTKPLRGSPCCRRAVTPAQRRDRGARPVARIFEPHLILG
jgi:hypothetical protein